MRRTGLSNSGQSKPSRVASFKRNFLRRVARATPGYRVEEADCSRRERTALTIRALWTGM
jgi:hypothetical protein